MISCVREVRALLLPTTKFTRVYLLTNRRPEWLEKPKDTLQKDPTRKGLDDWEHIGTGQDLRLTGKQKHNSQAVDMAIFAARRGLYRQRGTSLGFLFAVVR
jgi:hypothetical protein